MLFTVWLLSFTSSSGGHVLSALAVSEEALPMSLSVDVGVVAGLSKVLLESGGVLAETRRF